MRSYGCNKNDDGERRSFFYRSIRLLGHCSLSLRALIGAFYWLSNIVYFLSNVPDYVESATFFDHRRHENDQKRMRSENGVWRKPMADFIQTATTSLTPDTYPSPSNHARCGNNYLKLNFLCDPDTLLSHTEAVIINRTLGRKFFHCFPSRVDQSSFFVRRALKPNRRVAVDLNNDLVTVVMNDMHNAMYEIPMRNDPEPFSNHFRSRRQQTTAAHRKNFYTIGIALAKTMQDDDLGKCGGESEKTEKSYDLDQERALRALLEKAKILPKMARKLRTNKWTNKNSGCYTDIMILVAQNVSLCHEGSKAVFFGAEPMIGLSFSARVKRLLTDTTNSEPNRKKWKIDPTNTDLTTVGNYRDHESRHSIPTSLNCQNRNCIINTITRIMHVLNDGLPFLANTDFRSDEPDDRSDQSASEPDDGDDPKRTPAPDRESPMTWFPNRQYAIPTWALIAFAVSACVTLGCAYLGHWLNTGRSRLHASSESSSSAKYHMHHNRRWRAGFGGGMLELHNKPGHGGGMGGGAPTRTVRAKMFGGMGMGPAGRRQANGAQHNYHRV